MYIYAAILIAGLAVGFSGAWKTQDWRYGAKEAERQRIEARDHLKKIDRGDEAAAKHEEFKAKESVRYVYRTKIVDRIVERPGYAAQCWDADGLRVLNDAISGSQPTSEPAPAVSGPAAPSR